MADLSKIPVPISAQEITKILPHRYPFLLIDKITHIDDKIVEGYKNVTINEPFFQGHFPEIPIMPGVLIVEALAQLGCCQLLLANDKPDDKLAVFAGIDKVRFKKPVLPGDKLELKTELLWERKDDQKGHSMGKSIATASVDGRVVVTGELMFALSNKNSLK